MSDASKTLETEAINLDYAKRIRGTFSEEEVNRGLMTAIQTFQAVANSSHLVSAETQSLAKNRVTEWDKRYKAWYAAE